MQKPNDKANSPANQKNMTNHHSQKFPKLQIFSFARIESTVEFLVTRLKRGGFSTQFFSNQALDSAK